MFFDACVQFGSTEKKIVKRFTWNETLWSKFTNKKMGTLYILDYGQVNKIFECNWSYPYCFVRNVTINFFLTEYRKIDDDTKNIVQSARKPISK